MNRFEFAARAQSARERRHVERGGRPSGIGGFKKEGAKIEQVKKMVNGNFPTLPVECDAGIYVNSCSMPSAADCEIAGELQTRIPMFIASHFQRLKPKSEKTPKKFAPHNNFR